MALTVESLALELAKAIEPLGDRLADGEIDVLFAELGLPAPDAVLIAPGLIATAGATITEVGNLPPRITALVDAIADEDVAAIAAAVGQLIPAVRSVITSIDGMATAIDAAAAGPATAEIRAFATALPDRLVAYLVATYLEREHPVLSGIGGLLGIVEVTPRAATVAAPAFVERTIRFERIGELLDDPVDVLTATYRWNTPQFDWDLLLQRLARFASRVSRFAFIQPDPAGGPSVLRIGMVDIGPTGDAIPGLRAGLRVDLAERVDASVPIRPGLALEIGLSGGLEAGAAIDVLPNGELRIDPPSSDVSGQARIGVAASRPGGDLTLLGVAGGTGLFAERLRATVGADLTWDLVAGTGSGELLIEAAVIDGRLVIDLSDADGFLSAILPDGGIQVPFDLLLGWSTARGVYVEGGAGLAIDVPIDVELGPIKLQMLHLGLTIGGDGLELEASGAVGANLGPFALAVERMGTTAVLSFPSAGGNLGPADLDFRFKPPSGIGLSLDAGVVKGGGYLYLDPDRGEYAGMLELNLGFVSIKAIGILTTELPGGADGWALLLLVFAEFSAIQLGFGFTLNGVGGVIGLQHGVSIDALQSGLRSGVLDSVLFPDDPVANAPALLADLRVVFPIVSRALTIGPALKLGWSTPALVTVSLGVILQFDDVLGSGPGAPSFSRVVLVGQLKVQIPPVDELGIDAPALIQLHVDIVGAYDVEDRALSIDAVLRDSHVAGMPLTGSLVVRANFGDDPTFILAVGGFHPRFTDLPPGLPPQERVGIQLAYDIVTVRIVGYVAITSNSFQTGAEASLVAAGGNFRVEAYIGFDALFLFEPRFHFEIDFRVGAAIKYKSHSLASVKVRGTVSGPGRWEVDGHASISILFFDVGIDFDVAWGEAPAPALPSVAVGPQIAAALSSTDAWHAELPAGDPLVTLRAADTAPGMVVHPLGQVVGLQKVVPLAIDIQRVGRSRPSDGTRFDIARVTIGGVDVDPDFRTEHFARAEYIDLSEEDKLSKPSFERFRAGIALSTDDFGVGAGQIAFESEWETFELGQDTPSEIHILTGAVLVSQASFSAAAQSAVVAEQRRRLAATPTVGVVQPGYAVTTEASPTEVAAGHEVVFTYTEAEQASAAAAGATMVLSAAELAAQP